MPRMRADSKSWRCPDALGLVSAFFPPHSKPATVRGCAVSMTEPGVKAYAGQIDDELHSGWAAMPQIWTSLGGLIFFECDIDLEDV